MKVAIVQTKPIINQINSNIKNILRFIDEAKEQDVELICFPEMALNGYEFKNLEWLVNEQKKYLNQLKDKADIYNITIVIGGIEKVEGKYYLAQYVIDQTINSYHKIHIGTKESKFVSAGECIKVFTKNELTFGIMMCYDTHFPELSTYMTLSGAQLILAPSATPNDSFMRVERWKKYLIARAYDNRVYVAANNLIFEHGGGGMICYNPDGEIMSSNFSNKEAMLVFKVEKHEYSKSSMKQKKFVLDRKTEVYKKAEDLLNQSNSNINSKFIHNKKTT